MGDRAMITETHADSLKKLGAGFISALKSAQIRALVRSGYLQLSLFDETSLAEITSPDFPGDASSSAATRRWRLSAPASGRSCFGPLKESWPK